MLSVKCKDQYGNSIDFNKDNNYTIIEVTGINPIKSQINTSTIIGAPGSLFNYSPSAGSSDSPKTGDAGAGVPAAIFALAAMTAVVMRKKKS